MNQLHGRQRRKAIAQTAAVMTLLAVCFAIGCNHGLQRAADRADSAWQDVETVLEKRAALGGELLVAVSGSSLEARLLGVDVIEVRLRLHDGVDPEGAAETYARLGRAIEALMDIAATNRRLASSHQLDELRRELARTESKLANARERHSSAVGRYNAAIGSFPLRLVTGYIGLTPRTAWAAPSPSGTASEPRADVRAAAVARD